MLLNKQANKQKWFEEEIQKYLETNDNENTIIQNLWDEQKQFLEGSSQQYRPSSKKQEKSQILTCDLNNLKDKNQKKKKPKFSRKRKL